MSREQKVLIAAVAALLAAPSSSQQRVEYEKCYGIVRAGQNHCGANDHSCAAKAQIDEDPNEWIFLPKGTCEKIAGAKLKPKEPYAPKPANALTGPGS